MARVGSVAAMYWITSSIVHSLAAAFGSCGLVTWLCCPVTEHTGVEGIPVGREGVGGHDYDFVFLMLEFGV